MGTGIADEILKPIDKPSPIAIGAKDLTALNSSNNDVVHCPWCIDAGLAWHIG